MCGLRSARRAAVRTSSLPDAQRLTSTGGPGARQYFHDHGLVNVHGFLGERPDERTQCNMPWSDFNSFENLSYDDFRRRAVDDSLSANEKIGFPDAYRQGKERAIFADITTKLPSLRSPKQAVLDVGPGCGSLPRLLIDQCRLTGSSLTLVDSPEMLDQLPDEPFVRKLAGRFPEEVQLDECTEQIDVVLVYSVLHYVVAAGGLWPFLERGLSLLAAGGAMLIGDVPNVSKRARFFTSEAGVAFHRRFAGDDSLPKLDSENETSSIDDSVVLEILKRSRRRGLDAYVLPQGADLPMANRREDILISRP